MHRDLGRAALLLLSTACATVPAPATVRPALPDVQFRLRDFRLADGMRILVEEDRANRLVGVFTVVGVGSVGDPPGKEGLAHLVEHLVFRSRPGGGASSWSQLEAAGAGYFNASTGWDATVYASEGSTELLPKLLAIELSRLREPLAGVDQQVLDVEREVVRNELRQRGENALGPELAFLQEAVFPPGHPYVRPVVGTHQSLDAITLEDLRRFVAEKYQPGNMTMLVIGDVELATIDATLARALPAGLFRPLAPAGPAPSRIAAQAGPPPAPPAAGLLRRNANVPSPELYLVWTLPRGFDADAVLIDFAKNAALAELSKAWRSDPDVVGISAFTVEGLQASMLVARATLRKGDHPDRTRERMLDQLVGLWAGGVSSEEPMGMASAAMAKDQAVAQARGGAVVRMMFDAEDLRHRGMSRVLSSHFTGDPRVYGRVIREMKELDGRRVSHFAEAYLGRDRARAVLVEPFPAGSKDATPGVTGLAPAGLELPAPPASADLGSALGRSCTAPRSEAAQERSGDLLTETLPNGLQVVVQRRRDSLPLAVVRLTVPRGRAFGPPGAAELASALGRRKAFFHGALGPIGVELDSRVLEDRSSMTLKGANGNLSDMLGQLADLVTSLHVETESLNVFRREFVDYLQRLEETPDARADRALHQALFGAHPYGRQALAAQLGEVSSADVNGWLDTAWSPRGAVLAVAGNLDVVEAMGEVKRLLSGWGGAAAPAPVAAVTRAPHPLTVLVTPRAGATQALLHLACLVDGSTAAQEVAARTVATLLDAELHRTLRQELGATYGIGATARTFLGGTEQLDWAGQLENARLGQALQVVSATLAGFARQGLTEGAIARTRWQVAREETLAAATCEGEAAAATQALLAGRPALDRSRTFERLQALEPQALQATWQDCRGTAVLSLVGDEARIRAALREAGLAP
jgi:zinc protease